MNDYLVNIKYEALDKSTQSLSLSIKAKNEHMAAHKAGAYCASKLGKVLDFTSVSEIPF